LARHFRRRSFLDDPRFEQRVFPAAAAFRAARANLVQLERQYETLPSEQAVGQIKLAQQQVEIARLELRRATRL
jgi:hypothetical protein